MASKADKHFGHNSKENSSWPFQSTMRSNSDFGTTTHGENLHKNEKCGSGARCKFEPFRYNTPYSVFTLLKLAFQASFFDANSSDPG